MHCDLLRQSHSLDQGRHLIYLVCQAAWKEGIVYGTWFDAGQSLEALKEQADQFLAKSPAPGGRLIIKDYKGFYSLSINSKDSLEEVWAKALFISDYGLLGIRLAKYYDGDIKLATQILEQDYQGRYDSELAYAVHWFKEHRLKDLPQDTAECIANYIDYDGLRRHLFNNDYFSIDIEGSCHVFIHR